MFAVTIRRLVTIGVTATVVFAVYPVSAGEQIGPVDERVQEELRFRQNFGLSTDIDTVRELMADPTAYTDYPVALTPEERAEMDRRIAMEDQMTPLEEAAEKLPGFAGHWIDQPAGGIITVAFVGDAEKREVDLRPLVPAGATMRVVNARYTQAELEALEDQIFAERSELGLAGISLGHLYVHLSTNRVVVGVRDLTTASNNALYRRYGDAVWTEISNPGPTVTVCQSRYNCYGPPLRAGVSGSFGCSIAFLVRHPASGNYGWLTAGHCAYGLPSTWYHAGEYHYGDQAWRIGDIMANCWPNCWYSDAARADICCTALVSRLVYKTNSTAGRTVSGAQGQDGDDEGNYVCLNAQMREGWSCGYIQGIGRMTFTEPNPDVWFDEQRFANYPLKVGDSGGAVHSAIIPQTGTVVAYGIQSGCTLVNPDGVTCDGQGTYSHIYRVGQELGVTVCSVSYPCNP